MKQELYENAYTNKNHFSFGKNWQDFLTTLNAKRIETAKRSLVEFLGGEDKIKGKSFIDIGCGSGLFSLAAYLLGASEVVSIDIDNFSIACTTHLKEKEGNPDHWKIIKGSALDKKFIRTLGTFDIVYSWGVLHHTGNMHAALRNIAILSNNSGQLYIALYNHNQKIFEGTSEFWLTAKKIYNRIPSIGKKIMEIVYSTYYISGLALNGKNPIKYIRNYQSLRGMNFFTDIKDWLGGYPYEFASIEEIDSYFKTVGFICTKTNPARSIGCNEFLFVKKV
jgi:2-polyprenyl-3-methyl-5-hydroxy-6-metoxy-1,4-benzoquinol methylase